MNNFSIYNTEQPFEDDYYGAEVVANQTIQWWPTDTEKNWQINKVKHPKVLKKRKWRKDSIEYTFNSKGFRSIEFKHEPNSIVWLGCSHTIGIGLPKEYTFAAIVSKHLRLANFNLGIGGAANSTCFRVGLYWIPIIKPKYVVYIAPHAFRLEHHVGARVYKQMNPHTIPNKGTEETLWSDFISHDGNVYIQEQKNLLAIQSLAANNNAKFLHYNANYFQAYQRDGKYENDWARDCMHAGPLRHKDFADIVIQDIINL